MTEKELFEEYLFSTEKFKFRNKAFLFMLDENGEYEDQPVLEHWQTWQAATQREGFKFVPVDNTSIMDIIHGKCPCGSSRSPVISDKQGYSLIHCFSCGANKYIHEDY